MLKTEDLITRPDDETQKDSLRHLIAGGLDHDAQIRHIMNLSIGHLSVDLIAYAVALFRSQMRCVDVQVENLVDLCGTGGDQSGSLYLILG